jgi:hypothetical protein
MPEVLTFRISMMRLLFLLGCLSSFSGLAQIRVGKLIIRPNQIYSLGNSDIVVADTLVMMDSSRIRLNGLKPENYIRAQVAIIGKYCVIDGRGIDGKRGANGVTGTTPIGPCQRGVAGRNGSRGLDGTSGINLFLYIDSLILKGTLTIDLSGGDGGDGGNGGFGGSGSPGTKHCNGGDGANGGNGGNGGSGGPGGKLTLGASTVAGVRPKMGEQIKLYYEGGTFGYGGVSGHGGAAGLAPKGRNGKSGSRGIDGSHGRSGNIGTILFEAQK